MRAFYNEIDRYCCDWLSNLMDRGLITPGKIDDRSICDLSPDDVAGYERVHFFAGIGGWDYALQLARWPDDRPVWTGSCPCQPFSAAGKGKAADDERHLWPAWAPLIAQCRPPTIFGEQVEAAIGWGWLDAVFADLEAEGYACGTAVLPACGVGAPHIRQRLWFVADARYEPAGWPARPDETQGGRTCGEFAGPSAAGLLADAMRGRAGHAPGQGVGTQAAADGKDGSLSRERLRAGEQGATGGVGDVGPPGLSPCECAEFSGTQQLDEGRAAQQPSRPPWADSGMGDAEGAHRRGQSAEGSGLHDRPFGISSPWSDVVWLPCTDGKARPVEPTIFPLAHAGDWGHGSRVGMLRAAGNAIVPQIAAEFIRAAI